VKTIVFGIEILLLIGLGAFFMWLMIKWAEWCGFGQGFPFHTKIQTLFGSKRKSDDPN